MIELRPLKSLLSAIVDNRGRTCPIAEDGLPLIATNCVKNTTLFPVLEKVRYVDRETYANWFRGHPVPGDLIFVLKGSPGRVCLTPDPVTFCIAQDMVALRANPDVVYPKYLFAALRAPEIQEAIGNLHVGSMIAHFKKGDFDRLLVPVPEMDSQIAIGDLYLSICEKIEQNTQTAATLEEMSRALYRSWFVDFDPVHAKAAGAAPAHIDAPTAALFPDRFGDDGLPEGWEMSSVSEIFNVVMGQSPPGDTYNDAGEGLPFFQGRTDFGFRYPANRKFCSAPGRIAAEGSILLSVRAPVGDLNRAWEQCCVGRGVASLLEIRGRNAYGYSAMWSLSEALLSFESEGTVFGAINKNQLFALQIVNPGEALIDAYESFAAPVDEKIRSLTESARTLTTLRDTLLPRLMSGELRVGEAREQVEDMM